MKLKSRAFTLVIFLAFVLPSHVSGQNQQVEYTIPELFIAASTADIKGEFDGNHENTVILFETEDMAYEAEIVKESAEGISIKTPPLPGTYNLIIDEATADFYIEEAVKVAEMELAIGKTNMRRGQKTQLSIQIKGIKGYTRPIIVEVKNKSPETITLPNGDFERIEIINETGQNSVRKELEVRALTRGGFDIEVNMVPEEILVHYDPEQLLKEMNEELNDSLFVTYNPITDTFKYIRDLIADNYHPEQDASYPYHNEEEIIKELSKLLNQPAGNENQTQKGNEPTTANKLQNWLKEFLKNYPLDSLRSTPTGETTGGPTTTSGRPKYPGDDGGKKDSTVCNCGINGKITHKLTKSFAITKDLKKADIAKKLQDKGLRFPEKDESGFKGEHVDLMPGMAYATAFGDVVGGYANAVANMWGREVEGGQAPKINFETEYIYAVSSTKGDHYIEITPAPGEWSQVIGFAAVSTSTKAKAIDPVEFERKLMMEFSRGKEVVDFVYTVYGFVTLGGKVQALISVFSDLFSAVMDVSGGSDYRKKRYTTDAYAYGYARSKYHVKVNSKSKGIKKSSKSYRSAKINKHLSLEELGKATNIEKGQSSKKQEAPKQKTVYVTDRHPTKVSAVVTGNARVSCEATGNGFAESGIETKTAVCVIGFCVNSEGAMKMQELHDSGMFVLNNDGEDIAKSETEEFDKKMNQYFQELSGKLKGKSKEGIENYINNNVEDEIKELIEDWMN